MDMQIYNLSAYLTSERSLGAALSLDTLLSSEGSKDSMSNFQDSVITPTHSKITLS